jgi:predicted methyltransferase
VHETKEMEIQMEKWRKKLRYKCRLYILIENDFEHQTWVTQKFSNVVLANTGANPTTLIYNYNY